MEAHNPLLKRPVITISKGSRWEHGSDFHWPDFKPRKDKMLPPWQGVSSVYFGTGQDVLRALIEFGAKTMNWKRVWIPSFFCQDVVKAIGQTEMEIRAYHDSLVEAPSCPTDFDSRDA